MTRFIALLWTVAYRWLPAPLARPITRIVFWWDARRIRHATSEASAKAVTSDVRARRASRTSA